MDNKIKLMLHCATMDFKIKNNIELVQLSIEYSRSFSSNKGKFTVNLENAITVWTIADFKKFNEILGMSDSAFNSALYIHNYLEACIKALNAEKNKYTFKLDIPFRKKIDDIINRFYKFNEILVDCYGIDSIEIDEKPKYKKCVVYAMILNYGKRTIEVFNGYSFNYCGYTLHVYDNKKLKSKFVIVPSCGLSIGCFNGSIKSAHEYIKDTINCLKNPEKQNEIAKIEKEFSALISERDFDIHYDSIVIAEPTAENTATKSEIKSKKTTNKTDIRYIIRFNAIYKKRIAKTKTVENSAKIDFIGYSGKAEKHYNKNVLLALNSNIVNISNSSVYSALTLSKLNILRGSPFYI